jgi:hypothetical protein
MVLLMGRRWRDLLADMVVLVRWWRICVTLCRVCRERRWQFVCR